MKIVNSVSETLGILTPVYGEHTKKKSSVFELHNGSRMGENMCKMTQEGGSQKRKGQMKCGQSSNLGVRRVAEELNMGICSE
jgi:hypothetical protein